MTSVTCPARLFLLAAINQEGPGFLWEMHAHNSLISWNLTAATFSFYFPGTNTWKGSTQVSSQSKANQKLARRIRGWRGTQRNNTTRAAQPRRRPMYLLRLPRVVTLARSDCDLGIWLSSLAVLPRGKCVRERDALY